MSIPQPPPGAREVGLWRVIDTDAQGGFVVEAHAPTSDVAWRLDAIALGNGAIGVARHDVPADAGPRLVLDPLAPGWPGDVARPQARVIAGETPLRGSLRVDGAAVATVAIGAGEVAVIPLPPLPAGGGVAIGLETADGPVRTGTLAFPLAPSLPTADGPVVVSLVGRIGGTPLGALALEADPWGDTPVRRAAAGLILAAALPSLAGQERATATRRLHAIVGAVREAPPPRDATAAAASLLLVTRAAPLLGAPAADVEAFAASIAEVEATTPRERLDLAFARAVAGAEVSDATLGRLVREADRLDAEGRARLARLLPRVGERPDLAWITGDGPEAALAAREVRGARAPSIEPLLAAPPPIGDPARAAWIEAVAPALAGPADARIATADGIVRGDAPIPGARSWREAAPNAATLALPASGDGLPARVAVGADGLPHRTPTRGPTCGTSDDPCRVPLGGGLVLPSGALAAQGGLAPLGPSALVVARAPGAFRIALRPAAGGQVPIVHVVVGDGTETPLGAAARVQAAALADARAEDPRPVLGDAPLSDWPAEHRPDVARLRFTWTDAADPAGRVAAFEDLRDEAPSSTLALDEIADTARAFRASGRPDRAIALWRRVIGQDALAGLAVGRSLEGVSGRLAAIQALREATRRAPPVEEVRSAAFALPDRLLDLADDLPPQALDAGVTPSDARLEAAAWDRSFLAWFPDSPEAPEAGLRLANTLYTLGARAAARDLAGDLRARHPDHALVDRWLLLEGVAHLELSEATAATRALRRLAEEDLPLGGGRVGPSSLRDDARFALGRLAEARDDVPEAVRWYGAASSVPDAATARAALTATTLTAEPVVRLPARGPTRVTITAANVEEAMVSAYAIDLRTVFLRESGLPRPDALRVEGLAPVHTRARRIAAGPFPTATALDLPLDGPGAWLVRVDADGASTATLVVRSDLQLASSDDDHRRLSARRGGRPVPGASVRALVGGGAFAAETDARGIASVPAGAPSLVWDGAHLAVTDDARPGATRTAPARRPAAPAADPLQRRLEEREKRRRGSNLRTYDFIGDEVDEALEVEGL
jgi:tetratricopeptide (TPR) repeat protein